MPKVKVTIHLTPDEFRETLEPNLQEAFDHLVKTLVENGVDEETAKSFVARNMLQAIKDLQKENNNLKGE